MLANIDLVITQQGDTEHALELWNQSLTFSEQIGDVGGKAATLANMALVISHQGDTERALELWNQSLPLKEQIGDVRGKAALLDNMAVVIVQQGDTKRALELWNQSLPLYEQIGDVGGKAATLANVAWLAGKEGNHERQRQLNLEAASSFASICAWLDLVTVLGNLSAFENPDAATFLAQALWLSIRIEVPADAAVSLAAALIEKVGYNTEMAPLIATSGMFLAQERGKDHPKKEEMQQMGAAMLSKCAVAHRIEEKKVMEWITGESLNDPARFLPALDRALEAIVGEDGWLFDRHLLTDTR
jgi:tetratricopeptide (TPR) repeat protein